jgi:hypothetical protein
MQIIDSEGNVLHPLFTPAIAIIDGTHLENIEHECFAKDFGANWQQRWALQVSS